MKNFVKRFCCQYLIINLHQDHHLDFQGNLQSAQDNNKTQWFLLKTCKFCVIYQSELEFRILWFRSMLVIDLENYSDEKSQNGEVIKFENSVKSIGYRWSRIGFQEFRRFCLNLENWKESLAKQPFYCKVFNIEWLKSYEA